MKSTFFIAVFSIIFLNANAQLFEGDVESHAGENFYDSAIGVRLGFDLGASYKVNLSNQNYAEFLALYNTSQIKLSALYELTNKISPGFNWYYGIGPVAEFGGGLALGFSPLAGLEFNLGDIPLNVSLDFMPTFRIIRIEENERRWDSNNVGMSFRYILN